MVSVYLVYKLEHRNRILILFIIDVDTEGKFFWKLYSFTKYCKNFVLSDLSSKDIVTIWVLYHHNFIVYSDQCFGFLYHLLVSYLLRNTNFLHPTYTLMTEEYSPYAEGYILSFVILSYKANDCQTSPHFYK